MVTIPALVGGLLGVLFIINGLFLGTKNDVLVRTYGHPQSKELSEGAEIRVISYNIAKAFSHKRGLKFATEEEVLWYLGEMAKALGPEKPDLVFLSEAIRVCGPCPVDQVAILADLLGMHASAFGENYNFGLPFYRIVGGNAILSKWPLEPAANPDLSGRKPFYVTRNNRRALWAKAHVGGKPLLMASLHNDSFDKKNNAVQAAQIVDYGKANGEGRILAAGDFNALPHWDSLKAFRSSGLFNGEWNGPNTFPAEGPSRTIDYILGPKDWEVVEHRVIGTEASDHLPVMTVFRVR